MDAQNKLIQQTWDMLHEGILNEQYKTIRTLDDRQGLLTRKIKAYLKDCDDLIIEARKLLTTPEVQVDFEQCYKLILKARGGGACIGAARLPEACERLEDYLQSEPSREGAISLLHDVQREYVILREKLTRLFELEKQIKKETGKVEWWF